MLSVLLLASACGTETSSEATTDTSVTTIAKNVANEKDLSQAKFSSPTRVDNRWFP